MADKDNKKGNNIINALGKAIRTSLDALYTSTYYASPKNKRDLENIKNDINRSISNITSSNTINTGIPNISSLYGRILDITKDPETSKKMEELFSNESLMAQLTDVVFQNQSLVELDREIDTICKYMPKLLEALETRKDNVLSADHFSKEFLNIKDSGTNIDEATFYARVNDIKNRYKLEENIEEWYDNASKYGEQFVYCVPYAKALEKLLKAKSKQIQTAYIKQESCKIITESGDEFVMSKPDESFSDKIPEIKLELNFGGIIESAIEETKIINEKASVIQESSLYHSFLESMGEEDLEPELRNKKTFDKTIDDELDFNGFEDSTSSDGLFTNKSSKKSKNVKISTRGCVLKKLERSHVVPIYIEDLCMGYYYFEFAQNDARDPINNTLSKGTTGTIPGMTSSTTSMLSTTTDNNLYNQQDGLLRYIAGNMSQYIDSKFINMNQDITKEIYMILKYNDLYNSGEPIKVSFIPPEDMTHIYWKKDKKTNHGISDLEKAFIPAILYVSLYLTLAIAQMTRGQDKRVYYVKQQVETNISKTLLNTIEQIKKGNFGVRQVQSINTMLNMVGRFNDYVIPVSPSGDAPVQFEVMEGQNIDTKPEFLRELEEMAINSTDVPIELIQARQSIDYAVQLTMTNSKFLRKVYNRQSRYEEFLNPLVSKIYNIEYDTNANITVTLQPPLFLNITNTNQIITNTNEFVEAISNIVLADEADENVKVIANKKLKIYYMSSYFNMGVIERIIEESRQEAVRIAVKTGETE